MSHITRPCADCPSPTPIDRRQFVQQSALGAAALATLAWPQVGRSAGTAEPVAETLVQRLYASLTPTQRQKICFAWDHIDPDRGLLRTRIANNWQITEPSINEDFYTGEQKSLVREIFQGIIQPDWHAKFDQQLNDDAGGWGNDQSIAIFGEPGQGKFEFVLTGRHMTLRCDGNSADHVAFGGPIFYGHAAQGFDEEPNHPGNVFWHQALQANAIFKMLDGKQQKIALLADSPDESAVGFRPDSYPGLAVREMSADQKAEVQKVLKTLIEPYRQSDQDEVVACLESQGGLDACHLAFYKDADIGSDQVWDNWRLEGPAFVWYFRGSPHVHVWVNVANQPQVPLNS